MNDNELIEQGKRLTDAGEYRSATEIFRKALAADPANAAAAFELGKACYLLHDYRNAETAFRDLLQRVPEHLHALMLLGKTYREAGKEHLAITTFETMVSRNLVSGETFRELGNLYRNEKLYGLAAAMFEKALAGNREDADLAFTLAELYNYEGKYEECRNMLSPLLRKCAAGDCRRMNRLRNEFEIADGRTVLESRPRIMLATLTNRCNLRCPMCGRGSTNWDIPERLVGEITGMLPYLELLTWQGGEVFLYPRFRQLLEATREQRELHQIIITNGLLVDAGWAELLAAQQRLDLTISIDSVCSERYRKLRKGGELDVLVRNVRRINELRRKYDSKMILTMRFTVMEENCAEIASIADFARTNQFDVVILYPVNEAGENVFSPGRGDGAKQVEKSRKELRAKLEEDGIRLLDWLPAPVPETPAAEAAAPAPRTGEEHRCERRVPLCFRPWKQLAVNVQGYVYPECLCTEPLGNIFENSFEELWNGEKMQRYRKQLAAGDYGWCNGGCVRGDIPPGHLKFVCE